MSLKSSNPQAKWGQLAPDGSKISVKTRLVREAKNRPCTDCNRMYPHYVMDFDHLPQFEKLFTIGSGSDHTIAELETEIAKCDVVCANCHRTRTWRRAHGKKVVCRVVRPISTGDAVIRSASQVGQNKISAGEGGDL